MKKYLMTGAAAFAMCAAFTSCSHDDIEVLTQSQINKAKYDQTFLQYVGGTIASSQDWGFGATAASRMTRSQATPAVLTISQPYSEAWVTEYNATAKEPTSTNVGHNANNANVHISNNVTIDWDDPQQVADRKYVYGDDGNQDTPAQRIAWAQEHHPDWVVYEDDPDWVLNFKITGTYSGGISVAGSEGIMDGGTLSGAERTIVVTGTWNITENQRIGSLGKIIIANGGTVNVAEGKTLNMVNQARLVVLPGGTLTGAGKVEVNNGNAEGQENYNGGTIDVAIFNNNFGKFYNYGSFLVNEYQGGAKESNFYNHALAAIDHFGGSTANARIFNGCQFYVENDARIRNYEGISSSALIVGGELMFSSSEDGTTTPTYVSLASGALVKCGTLYNNGTSWTGPTSGYAALEITDKITYLNWEQDHPERGGYFANNIYVKSATWDNVPTGNGWQAGDTSTAEYKFFSIVGNAVGNGGVKKVEDGDTELIPADPDFELGEAGCTPGFKGDIPVVREYDLRIIGEDLSAEEAGDFDFNDVVFDVKYDAENAYIKLLAAGGTLKLRLDKKDAFEVHELFKVDTDYMVNTNAAGIGRKGNAGRSIKPVEFRLGRGITSAAEAKTITIEVWKNDEWQELTAEKAEPAAKLAVGTDYDWLAERTSIKDEYTGFVEWVNTNDSRLSKWWQVSE